METLVFSTTNSKMCHNYPSTHIKNATRKEALLRRGHAPTHIHHKRRTTLDFRTESFEYVIQVLSKLQKE